MHCFEIFAYESDGQSDIGRLVIVIPHHV